MFSDALPYHIKVKNQGSLSLSVYNKVEALARPKTGNVNILKGIKGLETVELDEEGNPIEPPEPDTRIADMKTPEGLVMLARTSTQQHRLDQMTECIEIKSRLAKDNINVDMQVL